MMIQILFDFAVFAISNIPSGININEGNERRKYQ